jgi:ribosome-associated heat shock protein Hsp15
LKRKTENGKWKICSIFHFPFYILPYKIMRLDLFLKSSRLILRRALAQEFCNAGLVKVNGIAGKSSREVKVDDEIEIKRSQKILRIKILQVPKNKQVSRVDASNLYQILLESSAESFATKTDDESNSKPIE